MQALDPALVVSLRPPRPARATIRRFARLSRAAHRFHRFAHHPLCGRYEQDVIRLGRRARVCRGCAFTLSGGVAGALAGVLLAPGATLSLAIALGAFALGLASFALRVSKSLTRFAPSAGLSFAFFAGLTARSAGGLVGAGLALAGFAALYVAYRARGPNRAPCATCPERSRPVCSGFLPIVRRERALLRKSRALFGA